MFYDKKHNFLFVFPFNIFFLYKNKKHHMGSTGEVFFKLKNTNIVQFSAKHQRNIKKLILKIIGNYYHITSIYQEEENIKEYTNVELLKYAMIFSLSCFRHFRLSSCAKTHYSSKWANVIANHYIVKSANLFSINDHSVPFVKCMRLYFICSYFCSSLN